jgi:hypothetical protein
LKFRCKNGAKKLWENLAGKNKKYVGKNEKYGGKKEKYGGKLLYINWRQKFHESGK